MKKIKVCLFLTSFLTHGGGAEKYFINLTRYLNKKGHFVNIVTMDYSFNLVLLYIYHLFHLDFSFLFKKIVIENKESENYIKKKLGQINWIKCSLKDLKKTLSSYDVIYAKNEWIDLLPLKYIGYQNLPPIVVGIHTPIYYPHTHSLSSRLHNIFYTNFLYKWLLNEAKLIHTSNPSTQDLVISKLKIPSIYIPYPYSQNKNEKSHNKFIFNRKLKNIAFIGRLTEQKGVDRLKNIIESLDKQTKLIKKIQINIFGSGGKTELNMIRSLAHKYSFVKYYGYIENKYMSNVLKQQDLLISPSLWETLPYNVLEAQSFGLPVIAYNIPGPQDIIINNITGILVKNEDEFYSKLIQYLDGKIFFDKRKIINNINKKFNPDVIYNNLYKMFNQFNE